MRRLHLSLGSLALAVADLRGFGVRAPNGAGRAIRFLRTASRASAPRLTSTDEPVPAVSAQPSSATSRPRQLPKAGSETVRAFGPSSTRNRQASSSQRRSRGAQEVPPRD